MYKLTFYGDCGYLADSRSLIVPPEGSKVRVKGFQFTVTGVVYVYGEDRDVEVTVTRFPEDM